MVKKDEDEVRTIYGKAKDIFNKSKVNLERVLDAHDQVQANPAQGSNQGPTRKSAKVAFSQIQKVLINMNMMMMMI